jgi:Fe-Mn family superoxide dismutase
LARRDFIQGAAAAGSALIATAARASLAQNAPCTGLKFMAYDIKPLPFDPKNIKGLSEKLLISHYENNYSGAVRRLNTLTTNSPSSILPRHPFSPSTGSNAKS